MARMYCNARGTIISTSRPLPPGAIELASGPLYRLRHCVIATAVPLTRGKGFRIPGNLTGPDLAGLALRYAATLQRAVDQNRGGRS